jgi:hypothetical protein
MTSQLRERLAEIGEEMAPARLPADLWRRGRRHRRREAARRVAAVVVVAVVAVALPALNGGAGGPAPAANDPSVPGTLRLPWPWQATVRQDPRGPATLLFSGDSLGLADYQEKVAVYGRDGSYRMLRFGAPDQVAGEVVRLSPDGRYVAHAGLADAPEDWLQVTDLTTGRTRAFAGPEGVNCCAVPTAWSPDGRSLLAVHYPRGAVGYEAQGYDRQPARLAILNVASGRAERLLDLEDDRWWLRSPSVAAWHPDGSRFVVEAEDEFVTVTPDGRVLARQPRLSNVRLAGPGAFAPDGRRYLVAENLGCAFVCEQEELSRRRWAVRFADAPGEYAEVEAAAVRVVGWRGGDPVLVAYRPGPEEVQEVGQSGGDVDPSLVDTVRLLALLPGGRPPRVLLDPPDEVAGLDVATDLVAAGRFGGEPSRPGLWPPGPLLTVPLGLVVALVVGVGAGLSARRRWRRRAWASTAAVPGSAPPRRT